MTQSWEADVAFRPLAPADFVAFAEPGYVKIAWTFRAEPSGAGTRCVAETRVVATSEDARRRFRRYRAVFSPGMLLVRLFALRAIKRAAERR